MVKELMVQQTWRRWTGSSLLSRLPMPMALVSFAVAGEDLGLEPGSGAVIAGATTLTTAALGPWAGRRFDRSEVRGRLQRNCVLAAVAVVLFMCLVEVRAPFVGLVLAAVLIGVPMAGMLAGFRALLLVAVEERRLRQAHFVESFMVELTYTTGPLLATVLILVGEVQVALAVMAACFLMAALALTKVPRMGPSVMDVVPASGRAKEYWYLCALGFVLAMGTGLVEGSVAGRLASLGLEASATGLYLLLFGVGSCVGGVVVSIRPLAPIQPLRTIGLLFLIFTLTVLPFALIDSAVGIAMVLPIAALPLVPLAGLASSLVESGVGEHGRGAGFGYFVTFTLAGAGTGILGAGLAGRSISSTAPPIASVVIFGCAAAICLAVSVYRGGGQGRRVAMAG